jgi:hypothetical protein
VITPIPISVIATPEGPLSRDHKDTSILVTATFGGLTPAQYATALGYPLGLQWVQTVVSLPSPSPLSLYEFGNPNSLATPPGPPFSDPPPNGYQGASGPFLAGYYPFYYPPINISSEKYTTSAGESAFVETDTSLSLSDAPADPCLPGGTQCYTTPATSGDLEFVDNLAGIVPCTTPGIGNCGVDSLANSEPIPFQYKGATVSGLVWTDTFNGIVDPNTGNGGIAALSNLFPVDGGSGTGGITILTGGAVPEPSTWVMIVFGFAGLGVAGHRRVKPRSVTAPTAA